MDHVVDDHGGLKVNSVVGAERSKSCKNTSLSKAFASPRKLKTRTSSNESEYEVVAELDNEDSENGACSGDSEDDPDGNDNNDLMRLDSSTKIKRVQVLDPSEPVEMDEVFVIVDDDANETPDENTERQETPEEKKQCLSDGDDFEMDDIIAEFAEQEKKGVPQLSDNEDEMDSILNEFAETQSNEFTIEKKSDANIILSSEGEDEMECLLEEFSKENASDNDSSKQKRTQHKDISLTNQIGKNSNLTKICDIKNDNLCDSSKQCKSSNNLNNQSLNVQQSCSVQKRDGDHSTDKSSNPVKRDCIIVCDTDEKSNFSNCSSIEILLDDDSMKASNQNISLKEMGETSTVILNCAVNDSPAFSFSDEENNDLNKMILDIVEDDTNDVNSNADVTNDIRSDNILDIPVLEKSTVVVESPVKPNSTNKSDKTLEVNSEVLTSNQIKISECFKEDISENVTSNEIVSFSIDKLYCNVENHSSVIPKTINDQIVSSNAVELSSIAIEDDASSQTNENITSKRNTDVEISDAVEGIVSSGATEKHNDKKTVHEDQNKEFEEINETILNDAPEKNDTAISKEGNDSTTDKHSVQFEISPDSVVTCNPHSDESMKLESKLDEEKKIKLDAEENCSIVGLKAEVKDHSDTTPNMTEEIILDKDSGVSSSSISTEFQVTADDKNKRKLEDDTDIDTKKFRKGNEKNEGSNYLNGDESSTSSTSGDFGLKNTNIEELVSDVTVADYKAVDKINSLIPWNPSEKIETSKTVLDRIAMYVCQEVVKESYKKKYLEEKSKVKELEEKIENLTKNLESFRLEFADFRDTQKITFAEQNFKAKLHTRTVGVNVKIYRESEIKQALSMQGTLKNKPAVLPENTTIKEEKPLLEPKTETLPVTSNIKVIKPGPTQLLLPNPQLKDTLITSVLTPQQTNVRKQLLPRIIAHSNRPVVGAQVMSGLQQRIPAPNVTVTGNRLIPFMSSATRTPSTRSVVLVPSSTITSSSRNNLIDLTKEEHARNAANGTSIPSTTVAKVTVPGMPNNPNVLVPLRDYLQLLPPGSKGTSVIQQAPVPRPTLIPQLPSNLIGARTVTYIVPQNSGIGGRGIPQFLPPTNQQVQFVLRVTNPGSAPTLSPVVNSIPRPATMPQPQLTTGTRTSSGLILFSHTSKHPAPFPKSPHYPDTKGKAIPPKPSLKGSKNSNGGIVLSWNMGLFRHHANISSYQLFAYQETDGPVDASLWKKVGDVNALPLPMACTLTQFVDKNRYYFTVRAVDVHQRYGPFSDPVSVLYDKEGDSSTKK